VILTYDFEPMSAPRFEPRSYSAEPQVFGKARNVDWRRVHSDRDGTQLIASQIQHDYAVAIRDAIVESHHRTIKAYAQATGTDYQRLSKVLRGEAIMRLEDIADAHRHLGVSIPNARFETQ